MMVEKSGDLTIAFLQASSQAIEAGAKFFEKKLVPSSKCQCRSVRQKIARVALWLNNWRFHEIPKRPAVSSRQ